MNSLIDVLGLDASGNLSRKKKKLLEAVIFMIICDILKKNYIKIAEEVFMTDGLMIRTLVNDLITNEEYSLDGLAVYTGAPEDVIYDISSGINNDPTITLSNKIIQLHYHTHRDLYSSLIKNLLDDSEETVRKNLTPCS